jgi:glycogen operon protein
MTVLGARPISGGIQFSVCARDADKVELCLFDQGQETRFPMARQGDVHIAVVEATSGQRYCYRAHGPWAPEKGMLFDPAKLLVDPYAIELDGRFRYDPRLAERGYDTAALVPKVVVTKQTETGILKPPLFSPGGLIYEINVRGFTQRHPDVPSQLRGTIGALAHPVILAHLQKLRVSAIELMPIVAWIDERHLPPLGLRDAWGYNPVVPMAIDPGLSPGGIAELIATIATLRQAGIGVILDLVLNHTGESDLVGPTLSLRGLDNRCYARAPNGTLINDAGTGNTLNSSDPVVRNMILETMRHFARLGVDGFRLDLAPIIARSPAFDSRAPIFDMIAQDPLLQNRILIAEPWDIGPGGYQLGRFPGQWLEWNDRYRDDVRRFWRGDNGMVGSLATRITGSSDIFAGDRTRSVNFVSSHDGFTLFDIVSYAEKHNEDNGESNRDGHNENYSWNNGVEGPSDVEEITQLRIAYQRALLATLFISRGTIQLTAGDEFGRTQRGNNNAYAQDNEMTWLDWERRDIATEEFVASCAAMRAANPTLLDIRFLKVAKWFDLSGNRMTQQIWENAETRGFEVRIPTVGDEFVAIRIDQRARLCMVRFSQE